MRRSPLFALISILITVAYVTLQPGTGEARKPDGGDPRLPGARPTIEAIDYPSLQAALDAIPEGGGLVRLPAGTFEIDEPLRLHSEDVCLEGTGTATHIKNVARDGQPALLIAPEDIETKPEARIWRVRLSNFRVTGNEASGHGIHARGVNELFIEGVTVSENGGDGIRMEDCYEDPRIVNSLITYNKRTGLVLVACHDIVVSSNQFEENQDALHCLDGFNLCMTGNCLDDHLGDGVVIANTYGSVVSGNMIEECQGTAIVLERDCYGITLSANVIAHEFADGIDLRDAHGCTVSANTFTIVKRHGLVIGPDSGRITVTGNNFSDSTIGPEGESRAEDDREAGGILLRNTSAVAIDGNTFAGVRPRAVTVEGTLRNVLFTDNVIEDAELDEGLFEPANGTDPAP